jgi:uncharacterized Zn-binding protein involved in type VI secretion
MPGAHRESDKRYCGATNKPGQQTVRVNGIPWTVEGQQNTHDNGALISRVGSTVRIGGIKVIVQGDTASSDDADHQPPKTDPKGHSGDVNAY